ncbi:mfs general substrate transporter [Lichtheimia corymbifera JMRC:FSU:9682]|uniref:Mfs general substrate transporter n=1 Tax=Lichtheimia corymbifera JMRC:FSU:9682 TaxID=1263082 RepID=A0A068RFE7_9FUNG|nr:mfs general substrate transporter [Lichtheimia corymbifera JMRC:FSU:9682]
MTTTTPVDVKSISKASITSKGSDIVVVKTREHPYSDTSSSSLEAGLSDDDDDDNTEGYDKTLQWTEDEERRIVRKLDFRLMPFMLIMSFVLNMDRTNLYDLAKDLGFTNDGVNVTIMVYSVLFTIFTLPSNFISKRIGAHLWIPIMMNSWGIVTWAHSLVHNYASFFVVRMLIAVTEAGFIPACLYYLTGWYKTTELATRLACFWGVQSFASAFSGLISFGIFRMSGMGGLEGWKWLFLLDGIFTHIIGVTAFFYLPSRPSRTQGVLRGRKGWFDERETKIAVTRLIRDDKSKTEQHSRITWDDVKECFLDTKVWMHLIATFVGFMTQTPTTTYLPTIIKDNGFSVTNANLLTVPAYIINLIFSIIIAWSSDRHGEVAFHALISVFWQLGSFIALRTLPVDAGRWSIYAAAMMAVAAPSWHGMHIAWLSSNAAPVGKRALALSMMVGFANLSHVPGAMFYQTWDAPRYYYGNTICIALQSVLAILFLSLRFRYSLTNRWRTYKWERMTQEEKKHYIQTTKAKGSNRLDFRFRI